MVKFGKVNKLKGEQVDQQDETTKELTPFQKDMINRFSTHHVDEKYTYAMQTIRNQCLKMSSFIDSYVPKGREQSLAITHLEEVMFWSNAGIARNQEGKHEK